MTISILGAGAFGTALAVNFSQTHDRVILWNRRQNHFELDGKMRSDRLSEHPVPENVLFTQDLDRALASDVILLSIPVQKVRAFLEGAASKLADKTIIACCKGIEVASHETPCDIIRNTVPGAIPAMLSGPGFARDIASLKPSAMSIAAAQIEDAESLQTRLSTPTLRLYATDDLKGVEIGGALKNVIALACGITTGAGYGESAKAALIARGFREMQSYAELEGANPETLTGLSGLGDLFLTAGSETSRNFSQGISIGKNNGRFEQTGATVEGVATAKALSDWAKEKNIELPITQAVSEVLDQHITLDQALQRLFDRPLKPEMK